MTHTLHPPPRPPRTTARPRREVLAVLTAATAIGSIGLGAGGTAGVLLAVDMTHTHAVAGLPVAVHLAGSAVGALLVSHQAAAGHRGRGLALGFAIGVLGAVVVTAAAAAGSLGWMLAGSALLGTANSSIFLTRYAAVDASAGTGRGRALGTVFLATATGAVLSPTLLGPSGRVAHALGLPPLTGLYLVAMLAFGCSALLFAAASAPGTPVLGGAARVLTAGRREQRGARPHLLDALAGTRVRIALFCLAATNFVMVGVMTIAPVHLTEHGHGLQAVGALVAVHVVGMFAPAPLNGYLADRLGALPVVLLGGVLLTAACLAGTSVDGHDMPLAAFHLVLTGVGWNCGVVGSTMLLTEAAPGALRPYTEGVGEATMGTAAAVVAPLAGALSAAAGYRLMSLSAAGIALLALVRLRRSHTAEDSRSPA